MNEEQVNPSQPERHYISGTSIVTVFHNEENLYNVTRIRIKKTNLEIEDKETVVTGYFPKLNEDEVYTFYGDFKEHPKFGLQFHVEQFKKELPQSRQGVVQYLSSDLFHGIGKKTAENIVDALGERAIFRILQNESVLKEVPRLSADKAEALVTQLREHQGLEEVMVKLTDLGFGPQLSMKIFQAYKQEALEIVQNNPYQLVEDIQGIGFSRADELGKRLGMATNHPDRLRAGILYVIEQECNQMGHVYVTADQLYGKTAELLRKSRHENLSEMDLTREVDALKADKKLIIQDEKIYFPPLFYAEKGLVKAIQKIMAQTQYEEQFPESEFLLALGELEERLDVQYAPSQRKGIQTALMSPMLLLTGGPGTGKTTVIKGIVELYAELHGCSLNPGDYKKDEAFPVLLVAPTGRAAKRMSEATGLPAVTIHRLLKWNGQEGFDHNEENPIDGKLLIVDEVSMVDLWLAHQLFKSLPANLQVILVGDEDQLPSVGPGQVLKDLLSSEVVPTVRLTDVYRQAEGSSIIDLAHEIKKGKLPEDLSRQQGDRSFIRCQGQHITNVVQQVCGNALKKGYTAKDIQVLAPMYKGPAGIDKLNEVLQELFNPASEQRRELKHGDIMYRVGDKVLQLVNQPDSNVFNGDMGEIVSVFFAKENTEKQDMLVISYEGNEVTYTKQDFNQITHAYCCSIHKSQGSEFPIVVLPIVKSYYRMLRRNLLYTAVTRSKQFLILCGEDEAFQLGVSRNEDSVRQTNLQPLLRESLDNDIEDPEIPFMKDANIGMENVTPYDFM
ncbi:SF1B family DNA helicase RecD2 [Priestia megaterium]|jgi:exodeoxyribonuclease V alpha subunit|uniref:SF1B family DNA helicase RecD2 n=1 Tax=Priestia megaterium TaxID=1404 RepID=UPI0018694E05|nr:ATP-dependent RecD-like DNA helicase [Priestia megaterium]MBE2974741.1 ATP-dependent RecD-like DNA helicase [Priestia megaterium]MBT2256899.1 ATP-dependent RecD-like DNA helicase [Priestia megaterium]MBT2276547.1 ATP-dependent RecD-like DNA helicase [Priestia megaterium]MCY9016225.1 ATP-dependent RecD-like DNA helicase [Priestia megaterium]MCY9022782.1 ATP-dependent RecD-like DNA helicase [Priestia megaterium]